MSNKQQINKVSSLIKQLISAARSRGVTQAQLAEMAGVSAVGLSKAKTRGDIRVSTLTNLASQLDLELALVPRQSRDKATESIKSGTFFNPPAVVESESNTNREH